MKNKIISPRGYWARMRERKKAVMRAFVKNEIVLDNGNFKTITLEKGEYDSMTPRQKDEHRIATLSRGWDTDKHRENHKQVILNNDPMEPLKMELDSINKMNRRIGAKLFYYEPANINRTPHKNLAAALPSMAGTQASSFRNLFSRSMRNSPYRISKKVSAKGIVRRIVKMIRPLRITLVKVNEYAITRVRKQSAITTIHKFKKSNSKRRTADSVSQVVFPRY